MVFIFAAVVGRRVNKPKDHTKSKPTSAQRSPQSSAVVPKMSHGIKSPHSTGASQHSETVGLSSTSVSPRVLDEPPSVKFCKLI